MRSLLVLVLSAIAATALLSQRRMPSRTAYLDTPEIAQLRSTLEGLYADLAELKALLARDAAIEKTLDHHLFQSRTPQLPKYLH